MRRKFFEALFDDFLRFQKVSFGGLWTEILENWSLKPKKSPEWHVWAVEKLIFEKVLSHQKGLQKFFYASLGRFSCVCKYS